MRFGEYEAIAEIGRGGMGVVIKARAPDGSAVAVKVLARLDAEHRAQFERERRLVASFTAEDGFVPLLASGEAPTGPFLVMPFLEGGSLRERLVKGPLDLDEAADLAERLAATLARAHERGVVHRDLKPENVLFGENEEGDRVALVADLGLAKHFDREAPGASQSVSLTRAGEVRGTAGYMAPEQLTDPQGVGPPADVFALGAIIYECFAGRPAFDAPTVVELLVKAREMAATPLRELRPEVPSALASVIDRALSKSAERRHADAGELLRALQAARKAPRRGRGVPIGALVAVVVAGALYAGMSFAGKGPPPPTPTAAVVTPPPLPPPAKPDAPRSDDPFTAEPPPWFVALQKSGARVPSELPRGVYYDKKAEGYWNAKDRSELIYVPAGSFDPGPAAVLVRPDSVESVVADGLPRGSVSLGAYFIGKYEASNAQYERYFQATKLRTDCEAGRVKATIINGTGDRRSDDASWRAPHGSRAYDPRWPVVQLTRADVEQYLAWAGLRLPTELEWERAAAWDEAAGRARRYAWGDERSGELCECLRLMETQPHLAPVDSHPGGRSPIGAFNMCGNAAEWVNGDDGRSVKGGGFASGEHILRCAFATGGEVCSNMIGFRVALTAR